MRICVDRVFVEFDLVFDVGVCFDFFVWWFEYWDLDHVIER